MVRPNLARTVSHWAVETRYANRLGCGKSFTKLGGTQIHCVAFQRDSEIPFASSTHGHDSLVQKGTII